MASVFDKLNLKRQREILVASAPVSFVDAIAALSGVTVRR